MSHVIGLTISKPEIKIKVFKFIDQVASETLKTIKFQGTSFDNHLWIIIQQRRISL